MRKSFVALIWTVFFWAGGAAAQLPPELQDSMAQARGIVQDLGGMMLGERLSEPTRLRDMAEVMSILTFALRDMAVHAEQGALTAAQSDRLAAELDKARLMVDQLEQRIFEEQLRRQQ